MPATPNLANLTIPAGIKLFFDDGSGMRDLGFVEGLDIEPKTDELKYFSNRSGKRRLAKVFTLEEECTLKFNLHEPNVNNLLAYFKGGDVAVVGEGTGAVVDQQVTLTGTVLFSLGRYGLSSVTVRQFLDKCLVYDGAHYVDNSVEADSVNGTPFDLLTDTDEFVYFGKATKFKEIYLGLAVNGSYASVLWEYWDGSAWQTLSVAGAGADLGADGKVNWTPPNNWATTVVNGSDALYWIRVSAGTVTTPATCNHVRQNAVQNTDWILDPGRVGGSGLLVGRVGRLSGGFLADGEEVKVSYTYTTWTSLTFPIAGSAYKEGAVRFEFHPKTGLQGNAHFHKCVLKPNGVMAFDDKKILEIPMLLDVLDDYDNNPDSPLGYWEPLSES